MKLVEMIIGVYVHVMVRIVGLRIPIWSPLNLAALSTSESHVRGELPDSYYRQEIRRRTKLMARSILKSLSWGYPFAHRRSAWVAARAAVRVVIKNPLWL